MTAQSAWWMLAIQWRPAGSPMHILAGAALLAGLAVLAYVRVFARNRKVGLALLAMRLALIAALAMLLMGPSRLPPEAAASGKPRLTVLVDTSGSMQTPDCQGLSRIEAAGKCLGLARLADEYDLDLRGFDSILQSLSAEALAKSPSALAAGRSSRIAACVTQAIQELPEGPAGSAMVVFSDGRDSAGANFQSAALLARARNVPVNTICLGGPTIVRDIVLVALPSQEYLLAGEPGEMVVELRQVGLDQAAGKLHVRCQGSPDLELPVEFKGNPGVVLKVPVRQDQPGLYEYRVSVDPVEGEREAGNNAQSVFFEVTNRRIKVLLLEGQPFWETKFLAQSLRKDARVELSQFTQVSTAKREVIVSGLVAGGPSTRPEAASAPSTGPAPVSLPKTADDWSAYNVVLLGRGLEQMLDRQSTAQLVEFVSTRGGCVVFTRAQAYDPEMPLGRQLGRDLAVIEPVIWGQGQQHHLGLSLTPQGRQAPLFAGAVFGDDPGAAMARLPGFSTMPEVLREKAGAEVLARATEAGALAGQADAGWPAIVTMNFGRGRTVAILGEGLWQWRFLPPQSKDLDGVYDHFWSSLVRWLAMSSDFLPGQAVSLKLGRSSSPLGEPASFDVVCKLKPAEGFKPVLKLTDPSGKSRELAALPLPGVEGRYRANFNPPAPGVYKVTLELPGQDATAVQEKKFSVYDVDMERLHVAAVPEELARLAEVSGGLALSADNAAQLPHELARQKSLRTTPQPPEFLWNHAGVLVLILAWAGVEWLARRKAGLL